MSRAIKSNKTRAPATATALFVGLVASGLRCGCEGTIAGDAGEGDGPGEAEDGGALDAAPGSDAGAPDAAATDGGFACRGIGAACASNAECCLGLCSLPDGGPGTCASRQCAASGASCAAALDCCSLACRSADGGPAICAASGGCTAMGAACSLPVDCCSNRCSATCQAGSGGCQGANQPCTADFACCSGTCTNELCVGTGSPCRVGGDSCSTDSQCCSSLCDPGTGKCRVLSVCRPAGEPCAAASSCCALTCASAYCANLRWCLPTFEPCETDIECCSGKCDRDPGGFKRCLAIGGCRTSGPVSTPKGALNDFGEICTAGYECCSSLCEPDADGVRRCKKRGDPRAGASLRVCLPQGELCETDPECCLPDGGQPRCERPPAPPNESAYPKRCLLFGETTCRPDGRPCVDPTQCCSGRCTLHPDQTYRCGVPPPSADAGPQPDAGPPGDAGACVSSGNACTADRDCCAGMRCVPDGRGGLVCLVIPN